MYHIRNEQNEIHPTAIICKNVVMGKGNVIGPGVVIGMTGFIRNLKGSHSSMVIIGDNNRIGLHTCIMSGEKGDTVIGSNNLLMNHVNVGHNCEIGSNCEIGAGTILGGWAVIYDNARIKLNCTIRNRIKIGKNTVIGMGSIVVKDVFDGDVVYGNPAKEK